jgi:hypothetical protein
MKPEDAVSLVGLAEKYGLAGVMILVVLVIFWLLIKSGYRIKVDVGPGGKP